MRRKSLPDQAPVRRSPRQERARHKVELMLEAAMQVLDESGLQALTTNGVAARAGVSIGTLYQYFDSKRALLDVLVAREMNTMWDRVVESLRGAPPDVPGGRIRHIVRAVVGAYGGRRRVHRLLMQRALTQEADERAPGTRPPLHPRLMALFTSDGVTGPGQVTYKLTAAQAFVLVHAMAGVLRSLAAGEQVPPLAEVEDALVHLVMGYLAGAQLPAA